MQRREFVDANEHSCKEVPIQRDGLNEAGIVGCHVAGCSRSRTSRSGRGGRCRSRGRGRGVVVGVTQELLDLFAIGTPWKSLECKLRRYGSDLFRSALSRAD